MKKIIIFSALMLMLSMPVMAAVVPIPGGVYYGFFNPVVEPFMTSSEVNGNIVSFHFLGTQFGTGAVELIDENGELIVIEEDDICTYHTIEAILPAGEYTWRGVLNWNRMTGYGANNVLIVK